MGMQGDEKENERMSGIKRKELGRACMLNTEVGAVLAAIRRKAELHPHFFSQEESHYDSPILQSLKSLRSLIFSPQQEWSTIDPSIYLSPFLDVVESDDVPATATAVALSAILKIFQNGDEKENERMSGIKRKELGRACMLNTEVGAVLAAIRRKAELHPHFFSQEESHYDSPILQSLKSLRSLIFSPQQEWSTIDPSIYLSPFLDVVESDDVPATATAVALSAILKIFRNNVFDEKTPGAKHAMAGAVTAITSCRLEKTDGASEDSVMMRILCVLTELVRHPASVLLTDQSICTIVNTCFQVVQQAANRGDLLQRSAMYTMHELVQIIFARLPDIEVKDEEISESDDEDAFDTRYGIRSAVDIFHFLCSLLNVVQVYHGEFDAAQGAMMPRQSFDEDVQLFALVLINSVVELSGDSIMNHPKLLRMIQDDLFHHLIHYGTRSTPLILSMISSIVLNIYHFLRRSVRLQLEAFFSFVLLRAASLGNAVQMQEVAIEGIINFCRQPSFITEAYVNYDTHPTFRNVFEDFGKLLCMHAFPANGPFTSLQVQAFEGLIIILQNIADSVDKEDNASPLGEYPIEVSEYRPFWEERGTDANGSESWVDFVRIRKAQKRKITIASNHYNRDDKKGLDYLKVSNLVSDPPVAKAFAMFFRFTPGLDKTMIGEYLGDPEEFHLEVLKEFTETFEFAGMALDSALRTYLESFRLPGESQKIHRIIEAFSNQYHDQQPSDLFQNGEVVLVLSYSLIMLNTDQHNPQVKKKMTEDEFIKNNRAINGGKDLPREYLSELFHSIATKEITVFGQNAATVEMNPNIWIQLINRSKKMKSFLACHTDRSLGRDMFAVIAGPSVATLSAIFEHSEEEEMLQECTEGLFSIARIAQYGLEDTLDELLASLCKFTTLLNPYASADETLYGFTNDMKPRMATLAVFAVANSFKESIRGGWRNIVDCLLKLKRLKLLPPNVVEPDNLIEPSDSADEDSESPDAKQRQCAGLIGRFSHFLSMESVEESLNLGLSEFEQNQKVIQQCRIGCIFSSSSTLSDEAMQDLGRSLIFAAAGKGQKFSTPVEEEETVAFCWDLLLTTTLVNVNRFATFWPNYHDYLLTVAQFPMFSPIPFVEKGIIVLVKVSNRILATYRPERVSEELIFTSINLMWKLEKEILDTCFEFLTIQMSRTLTKYSGNIQTQLGWKSLLHLLSITGRHQETYDQAVETLIFLMSGGTHIYRTNYIYCIDCAFGFVALRNSPVETNKKIMDLMAESVKNLVEWYRSGYSDPGSNTSNSSSTDDNSKALASSNFTVNLFVRLGEALRKTSLARREGIRNHAITSLQRSFTLAEELYFSPTNIINCLNLVLFAMVDDLHEKMLEYSRRENAEKETRSMEGTLKLSMELLTNVYLQFLKPISESPGFKAFWLGILRRMDTCMKADLGVYGVPDLQQLVPDLLREIIIAMKDKNLLVPTEGDDLWEITYIQIQWIAPSVKDELFPDV